MGKIWFVQPHNLKEVTGDDKMNKFEKAIEDLTMFILGDRRDEQDRRVKKSKEKCFRRKRKM